MCAYAGGWGVGPGRTQICPEVQGRALGRCPGVMGDGRRPVAPRPKPFSAMPDAPKCASAHRQVYRYGSVGHARRGLSFGIPQPPWTRNGPPLRYEIDMPTGRSRSCHPNLHLKVRWNCGPCVAWSQRSTSSRATSPPDSETGRLRRGSPSRAVALVFCGQANPDLHVVFKLDAFFG